MLYDLVGILLIIGFSFLFKISITKGYDEQLIFILLALVIMVIYKFLTYRHIIRNTSISIEKFADFSTELNEFLGQDIPTGINQTNINDYRSQIAALQDKVDIMNQYLKDLSERATTDNQNTIAPIGGLDFQAGQQIQDYRIKKIQADIQRTSDLIKQNRLAEDAKKYNKIKVFSSCVVSGADGGYSRDTPSITSSNLSASQMNNSSPAPMTASATGLDTPSAAPVLPASSSATIGAGSGIDWSAVANSIANNGININLSR